MLLAILGMTGSGGFFQKQTITFANAVAEVPRVSRWEGSDELTITFNDAAPSHQISITQPFFDRFSIERIQPEPERNVLQPNSQSMTFPTEGLPPHQVKISLRAGHFGWTSFKMTIGNETKPINLIVLP